MLNHLNRPWVIITNEFTLRLANGPIPTVRMFGYMIYVLTEVSVLLGSLWVPVYILHVKASHMREDYKISKIRLEVAFLGNPYGF